jgi:hypothetical protein
MDRDSPYAPCVYREAKWQRLCSPATPGSLDRRQLGDLLFRDGAKRGSCAAKEFVEGHLGSASFLHAHHPGLASPRAKRSIFGRVG